jgi:hypothetical protein
MTAARGPRPTLLTAGDWVRIRLPKRGHKLAPVYTEPHEVAKVSGNCVVLRNGQRWNLRRCLRHRASMRSASAYGAQPGEQSSIQHSPPPSDSEPEDAADFIFPARSSVPAAAVAEIFDTKHSRSVAADRPVPRRSQTPTPAT